MGTSANSLNGRAADCGSISPISGKLFMRQESFRPDGIAASVGSCIIEIASRTFGRIQHMLKTAL